MSTLQELKQEATDLGIEFSANIGATKLAEKIEDYYKSQETSGEEIQAAVEAKEAKEKSEEKPAVKGKEDKYARAKKAEERARQTRIVTITDNDTRENNQTTVAIANCSNLYFDLGTVYIPLNIPVEIKQGHLDTLANLEIPLHVKDAKSGLFKTEVRKRYSISYEQIDK
jgi:hypothetical protein